jgi:hypothetical protein
VHGYAGEGYPQIITIRGSQGGALNEIPGYRDGALVATFVVSGCAAVIGPLAGVARTFTWPQGPAVAASVDAAINLILAASNFTAGLVYVNRPPSSAPDHLVVREEFRGSSSLSLA